jgi:transcriptional regulator with XRE-family HTH domain
MQTGRKILNLRCDRKISQQDLAKACSITPSALSKIEAGINSPRAYIVWRIAKKLGVTVEYLLDENMPYPYTGYSYRQELLSKNQDPLSTVKLEVSREEKAFLEALRKTNQVAREAAFAIPEASVENLRMLHFLLHHSKVQNPSPSFLEAYESLITTGSVNSEKKLARKR